MAVPSSNRRPPQPFKLNVTKLLLLILLLISILLSLLAVQLSVQLSQSHGSSETSQDQSAPPLNINAQPRKLALVPEELKATVHIKDKEFLDNSGKYAKDRVYCMVPFIWNPKIYDASK
eukprot:scaffold17278_cov57-Cyclotella_meneghiniana.AAC.1